MDIILHIGAHRTGTTTFQHYLRENEAALAARGIVAWGPRMTRNGLLTGVLPVLGGASPREQMQEAKTRIRAAIGEAREQGIRQLVVSDENMIGAPRDNRRQAALYPPMAHRMQRFVKAFGQDVRRVALSIRPQDEFWTSVLTYSVMRGHGVPEAGELAALVERSHAWRDMITALGHALPGVEIYVFPHDCYAGRPDLRLARMTAPDAPDEGPMPAAVFGTRLNVSPELPRLHEIAQRHGPHAARLPGGDGRWCPFSLKQLCALREIYREDLCWLRAGADGLATLTEETGPAIRGTNPAGAQMRRGQRHGIQERRLA